MSPKHEDDLDIDSYLELAGLTETNKNIGNVTKDMHENKVLADLSSDEKSMKAELKDIGEDVFRINEQAAGCFGK